MDLGIWSLGSTGSLESGGMQGPNHIGSGTSLRIWGSRGLLWGSRVWVHKARATDFRSGTALTWGLVYSGGLESGGLLLGVWSLGIYRARDTDFGSGTTHAKL